MAARIRLLYTIPNFKTAGSQYVLLALINGVDKKRFNVFIAVDKHPELIPKEIPGSKQIYFRKSGNILKDVTIFRKILKENKIDIVHSWDYKSEIVEAIACRLAGKIYLFTKKNNAWSRKWLLKGFLAHAIVYDNPDMKERFFKAFFFRNKITFIPHGVDITIFRPKPELPHLSFNLCCVGNIVPNKNQLFLIKSLIKLPANIHLHLYGMEDEEYMKILKKFIEDNGLQQRILFHKVVKNNTLPEIFRSQDLFVLASKNEGLPVSILESLACGVPVLSTDSGGGARYILQDEAGGYIFNLDQEEEFVKKVILLKEHPMLYDQKIEQAVQNVHKRFRLESEITAYEDLYCRIKL